MKKNMTIKVIQYATILMYFISSACMKTEQADLIITHATVYTCDEQFSTVESFAVKDGKIIATGSSRDILKQYTSENIINAEGKFIYPGFYDAHCHFLGYGINKELYADLSEATTMENAVEQLIEFRKSRNDYWVLGRGWNQNNWPGSTFPDKTILDKHFPDNPVFLIRIDGHAAWVNSKAMEIAGITSATTCEGGAILVRKGKPSGILIDEAMELVRKHIPLPDKATKTRALQNAQNDCFGYGLTSVADAGLSVEEVKLIDSLQQSSDLLIRIYAMLDPFSEGFEEYVKNGIYVTDKLSVRAIKLYADGALGSRGACLLQPYSDERNNYGIIVNSPEIMEKYAFMAKEYGYQVCIHAIGDSANRMVLNIYASLLPPDNDLRWRAEHAQVIHPSDFEIFGTYNIIPSIQATHATSDMSWAEKRLGKERIQYAYAYKKLLEQNGWLCNGTDFPVEQINPLLTFYASVGRMDNDGFPEGGFQIENALSREETLLSMTLWAARAGFEENQKGSIEAGKWADFVIFDEDLMTVELKKIPSMKVNATYLNGQCVYEKK